MSEDNPKIQYVPPGMNHFDAAALCVMCACIQADKDLPMDRAALFGIEGATELAEALDRHYAKQKEKSES
jgi:hypothetical protein